MGKVSLKTKNPLGSGIELVSIKTWIGIGAFSIVAGVAYALVRRVGAKADKMMENPALSAYKDLMG